MAEAAILFGNVFWVARSQATAEAVDRRLSASQPNGKCCTSGLCQGSSSQFCLCSQSFQFDFAWILVLSHQFFRFVSGLSGGSKLDQLQNLHACPRIALEVRLERISSSALVFLQLGQFFDCWRWRFGSNWRISSFLGFCFSLQLLDQSQEVFPTWVEVDWPGLIPGNHVLDLPFGDRLWQQFQKPHRCHIEQQQKPFDELHTRR